MRILVDGQIVELRDDRIWTLDELKSEAKKYEKSDSCKSLSSEEVVNTWDNVIHNLSFMTAEEAGKFADYIFEGCGTNLDPSCSGLCLSAKDILHYRGGVCDDTAERVHYPYEDIKNTLRVLYNKYEHRWVVRFTANPYYGEY